MMAAAVCRATAQEEYRLELGAAAGLSVYGGDCGTMPGGALEALCARWKQSSRTAVRFDISHSAVKGNSRKVFMPEGMGGSFDRSVWSAGAAWEIHLLGYGRGAAYRQLHPLVPFLSLGAGACLATGGGAASSAGVFLAPGAGIKYKPASRWNIALVFEARFSSTDALDAAGGTATGADNPYGTNSNGAVFKNKDCFMPVMLTVTYDLMPKCKNCNNIIYAY